MLQTDNVLMLKQTNYQGSAFANRPINNGLVLEKDETSSIIKILIFFKYIFYV